MDRDTYSIWSLSASDPPRLRIAPFLAIGKEIFLPEQATRTSRHSSSATAALRCLSSFQGSTRRLWWPRSLSTFANCPSSYDAPNDLAVRRALEAACVEFIDENGTSPGVCLRKTPPLAKRNADRPR